MLAIVLFVLLLLSIPGKDLNHGYLNYVEPDTTSSTSEIAEMLDETPGLERVHKAPRFFTWYTAVVLESS